jgi:hypothetical protein
MSGGVLGHSPNTSVRDRARRAESDAQGPEPVIRPANTTTAGFGTNAEGFSVSQRDWDKRKQFAAEEAAAYKASPTGIADQCLAEYKRREAAQAAQEAADIASGKLTIVTDATIERDLRKKYQDAADAKRLADQQSKDQVRDKLLAITYSEMGATDSEIKSINSLVRQNHPARFGEIGLHKLTLMKLRHALSGKD